MIAGDRCPHPRKSSGRSLAATVLISTLCAALIGAAAAFADGAPDLEALRATRERPLFSATRRPPPPPVLARPPSAEPQQQPEVVLSAVIIGADVEVAFLRRGKDKAFPVRTGADVDGWVVTQIAPRYVVLENSSRSVTLEFPKRGGGTVSTVASNATPRPKPARR
ncbi:MAG TPA: hypothetical protein VGC77_14420 [Rhodopseudomonas sp.]|uniref:hypothetical protein n=1 Tax=Rhodopseudomonas sp. TaxID=1078 RepID=UPI002ED8E636